MVAFRFKRRRGRPLWLVCLLPSAICFEVEAEVAICLSGEARSLVRPEVRANIGMGLVAPFGGRADLFAFLAAGVIPEEVVREAAAELRPVELCIDTEREACALSARLPEPPRPPPAADTRGCLTEGFTQFARIARCFDAVRAREAQRGTAYRWLVRARPDMAYEAALPAYAPASGLGWRSLREDTAWILYPRPSARRAVLPLTRVSFIDDMLAVLPRRLAEAYFRTADDFTGCIPPSPPIIVAGSGVAANASGAGGGCARKTKYRFAECRLLQSLRTRAPAPAYIGALPIGFMRAHIVRCEPASATPRLHTAAIASAQRARSLQGAREEAGAARLVAGPPLMPASTPPIAARGLPVPSAGQRELGGGAYCARISLVERRTKLGKQKPAADDTAGGTTRRGTGGKWALVDATAVRLPERLRESRWADRDYISNVSSAGTVQPSR